MCEYQEELNIIGFVFVFDDITWRIRIDDMLKISENGNNERLFTWN